MSGLEGVVRPFQSRDITPPRRSVNFGGSSAGPLQITIGGTPGAGYQIAVSISHALLPGGVVTVQYTLIAGDNLQDATLGITNVINANATLLGLGITASGVAGSPLLLNINQPVALTPQATISASVTGGLTLAMSSGVVQITVRRTGTIKTATGSWNSSESKYVHKWPKEMTFSDVLNARIPFRQLTPDDPGFVSQI